MRLLVLGGTHHVGRAVVETALARGDDVTTLTRGISGPSAAGALALQAPAAKEMLADLDPARRAGSWHLVSPDGHRFSAGAGAPPLSSRAALTPRSGQARRGRAGAWR